MLRRLFEPVPGWQPHWKRTAIFVMLYCAFGTAVLVLIGMRLKIYSVAAMIALIISFLWWWRPYGFVVSRSREFSEDERRRTNHPVGPHASAIH